MARYDLDIREMASLIIKLFAFLGVMSPELRSTRSAVMFYIRASVLTGFIYGGLAIGMATNSFVKFRLGDVQEMVSLTYLWITDFAGVLKILNMIKNRRRIASLIKSMNKKEFQPKSCYQQQILKEYIRRSKMMWIIMVGTSVCCCLFFGIYPLTSERGPFLPIEAYFPFDTDDSLNFIFAYAFEILGIIVSGANSFNSDSLLTALMTMVTAQLTLLDDSLKNIREHSVVELEEANVRNQREISPELLHQKMNERIMDCVRHHIEIIKFKEETTALFSSVTFGQFFVSILVLCTTLFEITMVPGDSLKMGLLLIYQTSMLMQIFVPCYFGNEMNYKSCQLTTAAYYSNWEIAPAQFKKNLLIFMKRSQVDMEFIIGGLFPLSLETFTKIIKSSWSFYTILNQMNSDNIQSAAQ